MAIRVLVGSINDKVAKQLGKFLIENGIRFMGSTTDSYDLLRRAHTVYPDLVIVDYKMKGMNGYELAEVLISKGTCPVIALVKAEEKHHFVNISQEATFVAITKPLKRQLFLNTIEMLIKTSKSIHKLEKEVRSLKSKDNERETINKAKKLLMEHMHLTEDEAHRKIQKQSMDKGIAKIKIADAIILMYE